MARGSCVTGKWGGTCVAGGHAWHGGRASQGEERAWQIPRDTVNERAVRILLECILVLCVNKASAIFGIGLCQCEMCLTFLRNSTGEAGGLEGRRQMAHPAPSHRKWQRCR